MISFGKYSYIKTGRIYADTWRIKAYLVWPQFDPDPDHIEWLCERHQPDGNSRNRFVGYGEFGNPGDRMGDRDGEGDAIVVVHPAKILMLSGGTKTLMGWRGWYRSMSSRCQFWSRTVRRQFSVNFTR